MHLYLGIVAFPRHSGMLVLRVHRRYQRSGRPFRVVYEQLIIKEFGGLDGLVIENLPDRSMTTLPRCSEAGRKLLT